MEGGGGQGGLPGGGNEELAVWRAVTEPPALSCSRTEGAHWISPQSRSPRAVQPPGELCSRDTGLGGWGGGIVWGEERARSRRDGSWAPSLPPTSAQTRTGCGSDRLSWGGEGGGLSQRGNGRRGTEDKAPRGTRPRTTATASTQHRRCPGAPAEPLCFPGGGAAVPTLQMRKVGAACGSGLAQSPGGSPTTHSQRHTQG